MASWRVRCPWTWAGARLPSPIRTRSSSRDAGVTKLDLIEYYLAVADGALRGVAGRPMILKRFVKGISRGGGLPEARPREAARLDRRRRAEVRLGHVGQGGRHPRCRRAGVGGQSRMRRPQPASGARRRPRAPRRAARGPRPDARRRVGTDRRRRAGGQGRARGLRPDGMAEDVGVEGLPHLRPHPPQLAVQAGAARRARPSPARSNSVRRSSPRAGGGRRSAASASSSTSTRTPRTAPSRRRTRCVRGPTPGCRRRCAGTRCPTAGPRRSRWRRCLPATPNSAIPGRAWTTRRAGLDALLELGEGTGTGGEGAEGRGERHRPPRVDACR